MKLSFYGDFLLNHPPASKVSLTTRFDRYPDSDQKIFIYTYYLLIKILILK